jgi:hypothetical protein
MYEILASCIKIYTIKKQFAIFLCNQYVTVFLNIPTSICSLDPAVQGSVDSVPCVVCPPVPAVIFSVLSFPSAVRPQAFAALVFAVSIPLAAYFLVLVGLVYFASIPLIPRLLLPALLVSLVSYLLADCFWGFVSCLFFFSFTSPSKYNT